MVMNLAYWCVSSLLFGVGIFILMVALLRSGAKSRLQNKRTAEIEWQSRQSSTDWWLDINK